MNAHPQADLLRAIADGKTVQIQEGQNYIGGDTRRWVDADPAAVLRVIACGATSARIKPPVRRYRVALKSEALFDGVFYTTTIDDQPEDESEMQSSRCFVRWLTDWIEYEV